jgi:hypothetical protein
MPFEKRRALEVFGQTGDRPYAERQLLPGDHDAQIGQGPINVHATEHLGALDRGVSMFRRYVREGIAAVERGEDPKGFYLHQGDVPPTFASDRVMPVSVLQGDPDDPATLVKAAETVGRDYLKASPMSVLKEIA